MEPDELEAFRKSWLRELETNNSEPIIESTKEADGKESSDDKPTCFTARNVPLNDDNLSVHKSELSDSSAKSTERYFEETRDTSRKCVKRRKSSTGEGKYAAFDIANDYLNFNTTDCKYCTTQNEQSSKCGRCKHTSHGEGKVRKKKYKKNNEKLCFKRDYDFSQSGETKITAEKEKENLVDLLIADIDEITCIPFFDIELPIELAVKIFQYLPIKDLIHCCTVNTKWRRLAGDDLIWFNLCDTLDVDRGVECVADRQNWNQYVKESVLERRRIQRKWKERCCEVRDLGWDEDLVLCSASIHGDNIVTSYLDGSIRLWDLSTGACGENLKEKHSNIEDVVLSICSCIHLNQKVCVAGFENGDVMVWKRDHKLHGQLVFMENYTHCVSSVTASNDGTHVLTSHASKFILLAHSDDGTENNWNWDRKFVHELPDTVCSVLLVKSMLSPVTMIASTSNRLTVHVPLQEDSVVLEQLTGATISTVDHKKSFVVTGISGFGYSILDGYRIRKYCVETGKQVGNIIGSQTGITCLNYADCYDDQVVVGCTDCSIRIHDFKNESLLVEINGIESNITCIQTDKWKVICGYENGTVCLWDRSNGVMCWQSHSSKHPVRIARFDDQLLTTVTVPEDKFKERIYYFEEKPASRRQQQGSLRVMDFTKDNITVGVPDACRAEYDDIAGYDYNIELVAPYDDVQTLRLPKI